MNCIKLTNGKCVIKHESGLSFIIDEGFEITWNHATAKDFNIRGEKLNTLRGKFWVSVKGTKCFEPSENGPHLLIHEKCTPLSDNLTQYKNNFLYFDKGDSDFLVTFLRGMRIDSYAIVPHNWHNTVSYDDI